LIAVVWIFAEEKFYFSRLDRRIAAFLNARFIFRVGPIVFLASRRLDLPCISPYDP